jgi:hypothetical protein
MAIMRGKGTTFSIDVGAGLAAVSQVISITQPEGQNETFEADYLDNPNAAIPHKSTGRSEGGNAGGEVWLDNTSHAGMMTLIKTPDTDGFSCSIGFVTGTWTFTGAGLSFGGGSVALSDGVKSNFSVKLDGVAEISAGT